MKPIYFPFTYVPGWAAEALAAGFQHFIVYQPSGRKVADDLQPWVEANVAEVRVPGQPDEQVLQEASKDFRSFASLYQNRKELKAAAVLRQQCSVPFFGETATSQILAAVKMSSQSESAAQDFNPLFWARIFLDFAQEFDRQSDQVNQGLDAFDLRSHQLLKNLSSEKESGLPATALGAEINVDDPAEYMALDRLRAWIQLFMEDPVGSGLFVTSSQSVFKHLIENLPAAEKIIQSARLPALKSTDNASIFWRNRFLKNINQLGEIQWSTASDAFTEAPLAKDNGPNVALTLYLVAGQSPPALFSQVLQDPSVDASRPNQMDGCKNTLIGLILR